MKLRSIFLTWLFCLGLPLTFAGCTHELNREFGGFENDEIQSAGIEPFGPETLPVTGVKKMLVTVTHWQGEHVLDRNQVELHTLSTEPDSLRSYILAASGGKLKLEGRVVEATSGPKPDACGMSTSIAEGRKTAEKNGLNPDDFDYEINVINCAGGALAFVPGKYIGVFGKAGSPHVYNHEFGHNLGFGHGGTLTGCPRNGTSVSAPGGCTYKSYGDTGDSVSGGSTLYPAVSRRYAGWLDESQATTIERSGLYSLRVLGEEGPQLYLVNIPESNSPGGAYYPWLSLEYRKPTRFDDFPENDNRVNGVWMRYARARGVQNVQIDATPETATTSDPTLLAGQTFEESSGRVKIRVCSAGPKEAIIAVALNGAGFPFCTTTVPAPVIAVPVEGASTGRKPVFAGTGWPGARIEIVNATEEVMGSAIADGNGNWSVHLPSAQETGNYTYTARQIFGPKTSVSSGRRSFRVADLNVTPAIIETPAEGVATGRMPLVSGTGIPGATVVLLKSYDPHNPLATTTVDGYGRWSVAIERPLPVNPPVFTMTGYQTLDGKRSMWLEDRKIRVIDVPDPAVIDLPAENVKTGRWPLVSGSGIAGATVVLLKANDPYNVLATATVDGYGRWSVQLQNPLPVSPPVFTMTGYQLLEGKRSGWLAARRISIVAVPDPAEIETPAENVTTGRHPLVSGSGVAGATVVLLKAYDPYNALATTTVNGYGRWSVQLQNPLPVSPPVLTMTGYQLLEGERSGWLADRHINVALVPDLATILTPLEGEETGREPIVSGTGIAGAVVVLLEHNKPNIPLASTIVDGYGKWSVKIERPLPISPAFYMTGYQLLEGVRSGWLARRTIKVVGP
jgi:hypothetical protein